MKPLVYIASPLSGDVERNLEFARKACRYAIEQDVAPFAPHLLYTQMLDDSSPAERQLGVEMGNQMLALCDELWLCGDRLSAGTADEKALAEQLGIGEATLEDIIMELEKPGRDPRDEMPKPILRTDVLDMKDLKEGMILKGTVRNVIDFGAFVDIGVHQDGLVHISKLTDKKFVKHPLDVVSVGDVVEVKVLNVDLQKKRIQLSMIL